MAPSTSAASQWQRSKTVLYDTGDGLDTLDAVAGQVGPSATIAPIYGAFARNGLA